MSDPIDELRVLASAAPPPSDGMNDYLEKVRTRAYAITDEDIAELRTAGSSEDEIFEQTVAVALREGLRRLDRAEEAIG